MKAQDGEDIGEYNLTDMQMKRDIIESEDFAREVRDQYAVRKSLSYDHTTMLKFHPWSKSSTKEVIDVNFPCKSMKAIVLLFRKEDAGDSKEFVFPKLKNVKVTVEGKPNDIYSKGLKRPDMYY